VLALSVLAVPVGRGPDRTAQASLLRSDGYARVLIAPAGVLTLISGIPLVEDLDLSLGTLWIAWGLVGLVLSIALGATLIRSTIERLRRLAENAPMDEARRLACQRRATVLYGINLLVLLSVVWAMVFKPTL
jgi:uncharacterized membrane protein